MICSNYTHCYKARTNSSLRVSIGAKVIQNYNVFEEYRLPSTSYLKKKCLRLQSIETIRLYDTNIVSQYNFQSNKICFDPNIENITYNENGNKVYYPVDDLEIIDTINGIQCTDMNGVLQFLLLPREISIREVNKDKLMETLNFLSKNRPQLNRGNRRSNNFYDENHSYVIIGKSINRYGKGSLDSNLSKDPNGYYKNRITILMRSMETKVKMYLDTRLIQTLNYVKNDLIQYDTLSNSNNKRNQIWSSLSNAVNYHSASHVDEDFFISIFCK